VRETEGIEPKQSSQFCRARKVPPARPVGGGVGVEKR